ncbi:MAG: 1-acyl-sn-glycerol-3-phosphate acyltransferase [Nitrospirota bacterium]|nr:1-acyl-sn-glycerol-3-phosphate acyltransferase [Nitrospirota bacterium]
MLTDKDSYVTGPERPRSLFSKIFLRPMISFYPQIFRIIWKNSRKAVKGFYDGDDWADSSLEILRTLENVGVRFEITGLDNLRSFEGPAVFIANHMSTLETFVLPCIIQPLKPLTFVVKKSLVSTPVFGPIMRSREPIVVGRVNPREDLKTVLNEGMKKIEQGVSIVIFPQSTRSAVFDPEEFNSLGIKLALKAGAPVVPVALKTDAWGTGKLIKDFGPVDKSKGVFFAFGEPMKIRDRGAEEHQKVIDFIQNSLAKWSSQ